MPHNPEAFADMVVMTVKSALAPVLERLAAAEARLTAAASQEKALTELRDRLVALETKQAMPPTADSTVLEMRDRVKSLEIAAAAPSAIEPLLQDVKARVLALEARQIPDVSSADLSGLRDRMVAMETRFAMPDTSAVNLAERITTIEGRIQDDTLAKDIGALRERVAVVEVRQAVPGPAGKDGKDGVDGLGFDDLSAEFDGDRTIHLKFQRGLAVKSFPIALPYMRQQGVYVEGRSYVKGDVVTWGGSQWHCETETTTKPGEGVKAWTLVVKRGRDGKDGRDAAGAPPVVSIGRPS